MIAFVILHYQAIDETKDCVKTIKEKVDANKKIIVVDNCSPNKSGKSLQAYYEKDEEVIVVLIDRNLGFAKGNNIGFREARKYSPEYIVVMNNDVFIDCDDFVGLIDNAYRETQFDILGPDIYSTRDNIHQNPQRMTNYSIKELQHQYRILKMKNTFGFLLRIKYLIPVLHTPKKINKEFVNHRLEQVVLHGACYIYSKKYIDTHNNCFYDETFMYYESYILHALACREKIKMIYDPRIRVKHHEDVATNETHGNGYEKAVFTNKCLSTSCRLFIQVLSDQSIRL